jgi:putative endopeptidase
MSIEEKYGALGSIIGHEISHAFDTSGARFDADGNFRNWWTEDDINAFLDRADKLAAYYDSVVAFDDGTPYRGQMVQAEAIADMAGFKCMLKMAEKIDDFDYDRFFRAYAHLWAEVETDNSVKELAITGSHPLNYLRVNVTVQQFDEFYETYDIEEGDGMYIAKEDRISVW